MMILKWLGKCVQIFFFCIFIKVSFSSGEELDGDEDDDHHSNSDGFETVDGSETEEVGEDQEMDELMRNHRFHHSDTEEENVSLNF